MSKKKKEEFEEQENINKDFEGDIHEADDTFGLPEIDYQPLTEEPKSVEEEISPVTGEEEVPSTPEEMESEPSEPFEETTEQSPYMYASREEDEPEVSTSDYYHTTTEEHYGDAEATPPEELYATEPVYAQSHEEEHAYVPGSYTPKHKSSNKAGIIVVVILILLALGGGLGYYFLSYKPEQDRLARQQQEQRQADADARRQQQEEQARADREAAAAAEEARKAREAEEAANARPDTGTVETISSRTGRYYVVVASAIDGDLAMDYANKLTRDGYNVKIIAPYGKTMFHRVAVKDLDTWDNAQSAANELKPDYGNGVWVIKY